MDYDSIFKAAVQRLHDEGRYRVFIDILRTKGNYPNAQCFAGHNGPKPITVWCSNDYLGMGQHHYVVAAMEKALQDVDEDAVAPLVMQAIDRGLENTVVVHAASPYPLALNCSLGEYPRFAKHRADYQHSTAKG